VIEKKERKERYSGEKGEEKKNTPVDSRTLKYSSHAKKNREKREEGRRREKGGREAFPLPFIW